MSYERKTQARVFVRLELEIMADGVWGVDCPIGQAQRQAVESALGWLENTFRKSMGGKAKLVGTPTTRVVAFDPEKASQADPEA